MIKQFSLFIALIGCTLSGYGQLPATWTINPVSFNYSMTVTTYINNDCVELMDNTNAVAAFVGTQCRGFAYTNVDGNGHKLAFLTIYSNVATGEAVELHFFKASSSQELTALDGVTFLSDAIIGTIASPFVTTTNHRPTGIFVSNLGVQENTVAGGFIGTISGADIDATQTLTFTLPAGSLDNGSFQITGNNLELNTVLDFAIKSSYQISIEVNDGVGCNYIDTFTVVVDDDAFPPIAVNDAATTNEDVSIAVNVLTNDTDYDNDIDVTAVELIDGPENGTATVTAGVITYTPTPDYVGLDSITYVVFDLTNTGALSDTAKLYLTVLEVSDGPVAIKDLAFTSEDFSTSIQVLLNDTDTEGNINASSLQIIEAPSNGIAVVVSGTVQYIPNANFHGTDTLVYSVCDLSTPTPLCDTALVVITVLSVPDKPVAVDDIVSLFENDTLDIAVLLNDTDIDNDIDPTTVNVIDGPNHGTITIDNGVITYIPTLNYNGPDTLEYAVCDLSSPTSLCDTAKVIFVVNSVPNPPFANLDVISTPEETAVDISVIVNDTDVENDIDAATVTIIAGPINGTATITAGVITYTPNVAFTGLETLIYSVCDQSLPTALCDTAYVRIQVIPVPDVPDDLIIDTLTLEEDNQPNAVVSHIRTIDTDLPADSFTYTFVAGENDDDNAQFIIDGDQLIITTRTIYEIKNLYKIRVRTTDSFGLHIEEAFNIDITDKGTANTLPASTYISNNGDGKNDFFTVENVVIYDQFQLSIYDQFGTRVYFKDNHYNNDFDGKMNNEPLPSGTYYYVFKQEEVTYSGNITIVN